METELINFDDLEKIISEAVSLSMQETYAGKLSDEDKAQEKVSDQIERDNLRAPAKSKDKDDVDEEDDEKKVTAKPKAVVSKEEIETVEEPAVEVPTELPETLEVEDLVKTINIIRSGESLKNKETFGRFDSYFTSLSAPQKIALKGFLDGLAQVIVGDVAGTDARRPNNEPYNVNMEAGPDQHPGEDPTSTKELEIEVGEEKPSGAAVPIIVGELADVTRVMQILRENQSV